SLEGWNRWKYFRLPNPGNPDPVTLLPIRLATYVAKQMTPADIKNDATNASRRGIQDLIGWLDKLLTLFGERLCLVVADHSGNEYPWEMLEVRDGQYLGARAQVVRWLPVQYYTEWRYLEILEKEHTGGVVAYL